ncbi:predicted protein [Thalassiosira pseudonana CCMP1335]|uniref:CBF1-interacting co-repressor CIR N-terminal domain-containing protein n=1 Tax=Thalassiosira pseudonana TaxID=35128 RepID=B8BSV4_THAPS|nr:predicted protein [Thalassiosira pseudonana CCMP1335]EED95612.1 predicted protein [Thalassiosira pseudonana CCMP1335]
MQAKRTTDRRSDVPELTRTHSSLIRISFTPIAPLHPTPLHHHHIIMGGGLAFLTKKSFNPANWSNQKQVWEARQKNETEKRRIAERESQLKREREEEDLARVVGGEEEGGRKALGFMYDGGKVPGLKREKNVGAGDDHAEEYGKSVCGDTNGGTTSSVYDRQPGDDDAAAMFRAMLARGTAASDDSKPAATVFGGGNDAAGILTNLEKAVGRGIVSGSGVTLAQQMERFPMLKGAPMALQKPAALSGGGEDGETNEQSITNIVGMNFKPLGQVLRNVQCLKCGKWGHARGDRECEVSGWDPFRATAPATIAPVVPVKESLPVGEETTKFEVVDTKDDSKHNKSDSDRKQKKEKKHRRKDDRHDKRKRKHKRRRHRSPSYSSDSSSYSDDDSRYRRSSKRVRGRHDSDEDGSVDEDKHFRSRRESRSKHHRSSRKHRHSRRRSRSHSPSSSSGDRR